MIVLEKKTEMPCSAERLFTWHETLPYAFNKLVPPGERVEIVHHDNSVEDGSRALLRTGIWPFLFRWELRHEGYVKNRQFCDRQVKGPFKSWYHIHIMVDLGNDRSILHDRVEFEMPLGFVGRFIAKAFVLPRLRKLFTYRHEATRDDLANVS